MRSVTGIIDNVWIEIYDKAVKDEEASEKSDVPIYRSSVYIKKRVPNSRDIYDQPVKSTDRENYRELFEMFERGEQAPLDGTPIDQWPGIDVASIESLKAANIFTVQALANMPETGMYRLPAGFMNLKSKAKKWLESGAEVERLKEQNKELMERLEKLESKGKQKGRPRKTEAA